MCQNNIEIIANALERMMKIRSQAKAIPSGNVSALWAVSAVQGHMLPSTDLASFPSYPINGAEACH